MLKIDRLILSPFFSSSANSANVRVEVFFFIHPPFPRVRLREQASGSEAFLKNRLKCREQEEKCYTYLPLQKNCHGPARHYGALFKSISLLDLRQLFKKTFSTCWVSHHTPLISQTASHHARVLSRRNQDQVNDEYRSNKNSNIVKKRGTEIEIDSKIAICGI